MALKQVSCIQIHVYVQDDKELYLCILYNTIEQPDFVFGTTIIKYIVYDIKTLTCVYTKRYYFSTSAKNLRTLLKQQGIRPLYYSKKGLSDYSLGIFTPVKIGSFISLIFLINSCPSLVSLLYFPIVDETMITRLPEIIFI